jgi:hypothetical protein
MTAQAPRAIKIIPREQGYLSARFSNLKCIHDCNTPSFSDVDATKKGTPWKIKPNPIKKTMICIDLLVEAAIGVDV